MLTQLFGKSFVYGTIAAALVATPALANGQGPGFSGVFQGNGLVTAVSGTCTTAVGDTFTSFLEAPVNLNSHGAMTNDHGHGPLGFVVRESVNTSTAFGVIIAVFPALPSPGKQATGNFKYGLEGGTLTTGTYQVTFTPLSFDSFLVHSQLTFTPLGGTATCTETDQVTYIRTGISPGNS